MDDVKLKALVAAVQCGSFSRAAEQLDYSQSGLTHMMDKLESELGCTILERGYQGIKLTPQGKELYPRIERIINEINGLYAAAATMVSDAPQELSIGVFASMSRTLLPEILYKFKKVYPNITVNVVVGGREMSRKLLNGDVQLALMDDLSSRGFDWIPLCSIPLVAVLPLYSDYDDSQPISINELIERGFISSPEQYVESMLPEGEGEKCMNVDASDDATIIAMVASGVGVSVLSELSVRGFEQSVKTVPLKTPMSCELGLAIKSMKNAPDTVKTFISFIKNHF